LKIERGNERTNEALGLGREREVGEREVGEREVGEREREEEEREEEDAGGLDSSSSKRWHAASLLHDARQTHTTQIHTTLT